MSADRVCCACGGSLSGRRTDALYCGDSCRSAARHERRRAVEKAAAAAVRTDTTPAVTEAVRAVHSRAQAVPAPDGGDALRRRGGRPRTTGEGRSRGVVCPACGFRYWTSRVWIAHGLPTCWICGEARMRCRDESDQLIADAAAARALPGARALLDGLSEAAREAVG